MAIHLIDERQAWEARPPRHGKTSTPWTLTLTDATGEGRTWADPEPTITITVPASEKTAAAMERMHRMYLTQRERLDVPDPEPRPPGRPWSKTVRTEQQQAAVSAAQAKRDRRAARNLRRQGA